MSENDLIILPAMPMIDTSFFDWLNSEIDLAIGIPREFFDKPDEQSFAE